MTHTKRATPSTPHATDSTTPNAKPAPQNATQSTQDAQSQIIAIIDKLKATCAAYGLGNDGNEYKIIITMFLYKFLNDKFACEAKNADSELKIAGKQWEQKIATYTEQDYQTLLYKIGTKSAHLQREHYLSALYSSQNEPDFATTLDSTLLAIAELNKDIFAIKTGGGQKVQLFESISNYIVDISNRDNFARACLSPLINFSFEDIFTQKYDFFATIFEYLIKDYNKDGGGKYAEYFTPQNVAHIMSRILVGQDSPKSVQAYDPSAGSGSLLMSLAHTISEDRCSIYSQDISQKSSTMLRLNLILNNLTHSIANIIQGNTLTTPQHSDKRFDFIISNPPFKLDFSDFSDTLKSLPNANERFFAGIPNVPKKDKDKMPIYLCFLQHIIYSLNDKGKAAVVVPTGFLTAQSTIEKTIRQRLVREKSLKGVVSMPSNIFATTGTNVSIIFIDKSDSHNDNKKVLLMDASKLGSKIKEGKNQKTLLSNAEESKIINTFLANEAIEDFSVLVDFESIKAKSYSFSAGQYFAVKCEHIDISEAEFKSKIADFSESLNAHFKTSHNLESEILTQIQNLRFGE
ncbi:HsdM family class I SAM-dependent methyltransferase [Helicobacter sp. T3_23-1059]